MEDDERRPPDKQGNRQYETISHVHLSQPRCVGLATERKVNAYLTKIFRKHVLLVNID